MAANLALYLPICAASPARPFVLAHLGQSLDNQIATASGDSNYVTGAANLDHLHRLRALADAVVVGAGTIAADDPRLTTRRVEGPNPVRVVIDPARRLDRGARVFADGEAPTLVVHATARIADQTNAVSSEAAADIGRPVPGVVNPGVVNQGAVGRSAATERQLSAAARSPGVDTLDVPRSGTGIDLRALLDLLAARGLDAVFVEGGGATVSAFVAAGLVDRLQLAFAPLLIGAGHAGLALPARQTMAECLRPRTAVFAMGADILFDCDLRAAASDRDAAAEAPVLRRVR